MKIVIGADHAGFVLKKDLVSFLSEEGHDVSDVGAHEYDEGDDYPDFIIPVAREVANSPDDTMGIVIGGSGQGEAIAANRIKGVRAIVFYGQYDPQNGRSVPREIRLAREHNDSNILSLGARFLTPLEAREAVSEWIDTEFSGEVRHIRRIKKIDALLEKKSFLKRNTLPMSASIAQGIAASIIGSIVLKLLGLF